MTFPLSQLPRSERWLLLRVALLLAGLRLALWCLPFSLIRRLLTHPILVVAFGPPVDGVPVGRLVWAIEAASRRIPRATCLVQSLALQFVLTRAGHASCLQIGVANDDVRGFQAHAWVDCEGVIQLNRRADVAGYRVLASFEAP